MTSPETSTSKQNNPQLPTKSEALKFWAWLGCVSFGGPAGQISIMHQELVDRKRWVDERQFLHALNYCMLLPGPEAQQLATYLGWLWHGVWGGIIAGTLFILPGFAVLLTMSWVAMQFGNLPLVHDFLLGCQAAVVAIVFAAVWRLGRKTLHSPVAFALAAMAFIGLVAGISFIWILLAAAICGALFLAPASHGSSTNNSASDADIELTTNGSAISHRKLFAQTVVRLLVFAAILLGIIFLLDYAMGEDHFTTKMAKFFTQAAFLTFGGAYAVLPYVGDYAINTAHWLDHAELANGLALGESTPGPLILVITYIGFVGGWHSVGVGSTTQPILLALAGGTVATACTFIPSFALVLIGAPWIEQLRHVQWLSRALAGISAAVVGVVARLGVLLALYVLWPHIFKDKQLLSQVSDWLHSPTWQLPIDGSQLLPQLQATLFAVISFVLLVRYKFSILQVVLGAGVLGLVIGLVTR